MCENHLPFLKVLEELRQADNYGKLKAMASVRFHTGV